MQRLLAPLLTLLWAAPAAMADSAPVVVELYTSQGCSSCPPADEMMQELADNPGVIALALHVDYWDYIGWQDTFGAPQYSDRQRAYARAKGETAIYTPQFIIGGASVVVGARAMDVMEAVQAQAALEMLTIRAALAGGVLTVEAEPPAEPRDFIVQLVRYLPSEHVEVLRGENAGQALTYVNVVTSWQRLAEWDGRAPLRLSQGIEGAEPAVVIVQEAGPGRIYGAAELRP